MHRLQLPPINKISIDFSIRKMFSAHCSICCCLYWRFLSDDNRGSSFSIIHIYLEHSSHPSYTPFIMLTGYRRFSSEKNVTNILCIGKAASQVNYQSNTCVTNGSLNSNSTPDFAFFLSPQLTPPPLSVFVVPLWYLLQNEKSRNNCNLWSYLERR